MAVEFHLFEYLSDNYGVLLRDDATGRVACVDAGEADAVLAALKEKGWELDELWITHWHWDHTDGLEEVRAATGCKVIGPAYEGGKSFTFDLSVKEGDSFSFGGVEVAVWHTPGHTLDMVNYYLPSEGVIFTGDTLFAMGCGRVFEGTHDQMFASMEKLRTLPSETVVYGAHEYTIANANFALSVDPENAALQARAKEVEALRKVGAPTMPTNMASELETNPFLRYDQPSLRATLGMEGAENGAVFSETRTRKDNF
ncbi:MAG: hydroxyacylglutathione hydrolase [Pseudomonadota bacterium]